MKREKEVMVEVKARREKSPRELAQVCRIGRGWNRTKPTP